MQGKNGQSTPGDGAMSAVHPFRSDAFVEAVEQQEQRQTG